MRLNARLVLSAFVFRAALGRQLCHDLLSACMPLPVQLRLRLTVRLLRLRSLPAPRLRPKSKFLLVLSFTFIMQLELHRLLKQSAEQRKLVPGVWDENVL